MKVTISIINYNYGRYLKQAIESALIQSYPGTEIEVLVLDDGSTDESDNVIAEYSRVPNFRSSKTQNMGFAASLTRAVLEASGDYVFFLDADDYFKPDKVAVILPLLLMGHLYVSDTSSYVNKDGTRRPGGASGSTSTIAVYKPAIIKLTPVENELWFHPLLSVGRGISIDDSYTFYRWHDNNMIDRKVPGKWQTYLAKMTNNLANRLVQLSGDNDLQSWDVTSTKILKTAYQFRALAYYNELETALELKEVIKAYKKYFYMVYWNIRAGKFISIFHIKMAIKTIILRPSFRSYR